MDCMSAFYVPVVQQAAHLSGGILINLLVLQLCFRLIDLLQIPGILKQQRDFKIYLTHLAFIDVMEL